MNSQTPDSLRLFYALWPDDATASALMQLQTSMRGRIIPYANLHLTLAFLGQQPVALLPALKDLLARLPRSDIVLTLDHVGYFPRNRIAWAGTRQTPAALPPLYAFLMQGLADCGISISNTRDFKPHVTLARDASLPPDLTFDPIGWHATRVVLVQSTTTAEGSQYRILATREIDKAVWVANENGTDEADASS